MATSAPREHELAQYITPSDAPVYQLRSKDAFEVLTVREKLYAHYMSQACWEGYKIVLIQTSPESPPAYELFMHTFRGQSAAELLRRAADAGVSEDDFKAFLAFVADFLTNGGNYKSFGDVKILPGLTKDAFWKIVTASSSYESNAELMDALWRDCGELLFDSSSSKLQLGLGKDVGVTTYYSADCTQADAEFVQGYMSERNISPYNTRLFKIKDGDDWFYQLRLAAAETGVLRDDTYKGKRIVVWRGDYSALMARVVAALREAVKYAANDTQQAMVEAYIRSYEGGSIDDHKAASRFWIRDRSPVVEHYGGFVESYRDPYGVRGEWEGFVAMVNKITSAKFTALVEAAERLLSLLPWPASFEKDTFLRPDFTSLEVLTFSSSGVPAGINIPNYDDIRQSEGFKNVSLGNVLSARDIKDRVNFILTRDQDAYKRLLVPSFEVQVGLHELLGHGSGKMFMQSESGELNFDKSVVDPVTGTPVESWYGPGQTWDSQFSTVASSYEECRAECVGLYLCVQPEVLSIFGFEGEKAQDVMYVNWLGMARAGVEALRFYLPEKKKWGQAHMQARFAILQVLLEAGQDFVQLLGEDPDAPAGEGEGADEGKRHMYVALDRAKIHSVGMPAIGAFLQKLQVYKATNNVAAGRAMYEKYTSVPESMLTLRDIVIENRKPRPMFVQPHTSVVGAAEGGEASGVALTEFEPSMAGVATSFLTRFPDPDPELVDLYRAERALHTVA